MTGLEDTPLPPDLLPPCHAVVLLSPADIMLVLADLVSAPPPPAAVALDNDTTPHICRHLQPSRTVNRRHSSAVATAIMPASSMASHDKAGLTVPGLHMASVLQA